VRAAVGRPPPAHATGGRGRDVLPFGARRAASARVALGLAAGAGGPGLLAFSLGLLALVVMALLSERPGNDDDDSSPGGGLMQPVA